MGGDPTRRNQSLYCTYHGEKGHTIEQCRVLKDHLEQLVKVGHLKEFLVSQEGANVGQRSGSRNNRALPPPLGIVEVIQATSRGISLNRWRGVLSMVSPSEAEASNRPDKRPRRASVQITFSEADFEGTSQPHEDALVVTSQIGKRVMVDQGSEVEIIYPDLYKGLRLKSEDLSRYDTPLVGFDGKIVTPKGQIKLLVVIEGMEVEVNFIVVNAFSPYTAILGRPWIHAMGAVPLTLLQKIKFLTKDGVAVVNKIKFQTIGRKLKFRSNLK